MNFLELAKKLRQEAGLSGTGPSAVSGQSGMDKKCVDWIKDAWYEIQTLHETWKWMWNDDGLVTGVAAQRKYDLVGLGFEVKNPVKESFRCRISGQSGTDMWMTWYEYEDFRQTFLYGQQQTGMPNSVTIDPSGQMQVDPVPDSAATYEIRFEYYENPTALSANTDTPSLPTKFHDIIWYRGLMKYASHDGAPEVYNDAKVNYEMWERRLEDSQLEAVVQGQTLA